MKTSFVSWFRDGMVRRDQDGGILFAEIHRDP